MQASEHRKLWQERVEQRRNSGLSQRTRAPAAMANAADKLLDTQTQWRRYQCGAGTGAGRAQVYPH
jgi:hypothetical protein